ncbi:MAG: hypothetical protein ACI81L_002912 [Verrucomicrobiales bacterium]|jgi:hypothetical protein
MSKNLKIAAGLAVVAVLAFLALGVFGIHTAFIDDEVAEAGPIFTSSGASGLPSDDMTDEEVDDTNEVMVDEKVLAEVEVSDDEPEMPEIQRLVEGSFIDRIHPGEGTAVVLGDGSAQRFLRFEEDFSVDNGPDLEVYLVAGTNAEGDRGLFDDDFVSLGELTGNIGSQNYEIPPDVDLDVYNTVVIWCVRFSVAFNAADLA